MKVKNIYLTKYFDTSFTCDLTISIYFYIFYLLFYNKYNYKVKKYIIAATKVIHDISDSTFRFLDRLPSV
jgi:hypothetical protein